VEQRLDLEVSLPERHFSSARSYLTSEHAKDECSYSRKANAAQNSEVCSTKDMMKSTR
jgi:hypothetical protein